MCIIAYNYFLSIVYGYYSRVVFKFKCYIFGVNIGERINVFGSILINRAPQSQISLGNDCSLISSDKVAIATSVFSKVRIRTYSPNAKIIINDKVELNSTSITCRSTMIKIGYGTLFGPNCLVLDSDFHSIWPAETRREIPAFDNDREVIIGKYVWVGTQSIVLKGVCIGDNSVIAAGSVVTKNVPSNCLVAGNPAVVVKYFK